jgi:sensor histidine kinase YesM
LLLQQSWRWLQAVLNTGPGEYIRVLLVCTVLAEAINLLDDNQGYRWLTFVCCYSYGLLTHIFVALAHRHFPHGGTISRYLLPASVAFVFASVLNLLISSWFITGLWHDLLGELLTALAVFSITVYWLFLIERDVRLQDQLRQAELAQLAGEKALIQSRLSLLQSQIEPHFLFNTIANLKACIELNPPQALQLVDHLTDLLRQSLKRSKDDLLPLSDELKFCQAYLAVQQLRLGARLHYQVVLDARVSEDWLLPPLLIQPLVENAVLHGVCQVERACRVSIKVSVTDAGQLQIMVCDDGAGLGQSQHIGHGIGLGNIRERLQYFYGSTAALRISGADGAGVCSTLLLPLASVPAGAGQQTELLDKTGVANGRTSLISG